MRAEVSRLRRTLGSVLLTRPYRVVEDVAVEVLLPTPAARLLPASTAPLVEGLRRG